LATHVVAHPLVHRRIARDFENRRPLESKAASPPGREGNHVGPAGTRGFVGGDDAACHWGATVRELIHVMRFEQAFAAIDFRLAATAAAGLGGMLF
jgi:hypothetical protein